MFTKGETDGGKDRLGSWNQHIYTTICKIEEEVGSRWQRNRTWCSPSPNQKKKRSTFRMIHTEHLPKAGRRPQTSKKGKKLTTYLVEQNEKRERERRSAGIAGSLKASEKSTIASLRRGKQRELHRPSPPPPRAPPPEILGWSLGSETLTLEVSLRKRTRLDHVETA